MNSQKVKVRFAPSPTGYLHIGGARTALFNYLFARHHHGQFLLRIEDTDVSRSDPELTKAILRSLQWLGLKWDQEVVYQSDRITLYCDICETLLKSGKAYRCFCTVEELEAKRELAKRESRDSKYDRTCLILSEAEIQKKLDADEPFTIRFLVPNGNTVFDDLVYGKVSINNTEIEDFIILRSDGSPIYQVAVVADDHDMGITHVIRGEDHLSNTPKQILLYQALGWPVPKFAHVPLILGPDKKRLSKRYGATSVEAYRQNGYLPDALVNFIVLLGWAPKTDEEILSLTNLIERFSIEGINKKSAVFDEQKLLWMNGIYIRSKSEKELHDLVIDLIRSIESVDVKWDADYVIRFIRLMKDRVRTLREFVSNGLYFFRDPFEYDPNGVQRYWQKENIIESFEVLKKRFISNNHWNESSLERIIRETAEEKNVGVGKVIHPVRLALTGSTASPGLFEMMALLGRESVLRRIEKAIDYIKSRSGHRK
jgi:glutamyl-tRNA synthetase